MADYGQIEDYHPDIASSESDGEDTRLISSSSSDTIIDEKSPTDDSGEKQSRLSEKGGEALARISRSKRLDLGVKEKMKFVEAWGKNMRG